MSEITLRKFTDSDKPILADMVKRGNYEDYEEFLNDECLNDLTIAEYKGTIAGFMFTGAYGGSSRVMILVSPEYRRRGIGTILYNQAEILAREAKSDSVWSYSRNREETEGFVNKIGYTQIREMVHMKYTGDLLPEKDFIIRKHTYDDFDRASYISSRAWHELRVRTGDTESKIIEPTEQDRENARETSDNSYVIEDNGQIVGVGYINGDYISGVCVDVALYNRGYGRALTIFLTNEILRRGNKAAYLAYQKGNDNAKHIYTTIGYEETYTSYCPLKKLRYN